MAASPTIKVYNGDEYIASFKDFTDAAILASVRGEGITIRTGHPASSIVWREGHEPIDPQESSYDLRALVCSARHAIRQEAAYIKVYGGLPEGHRPARERYAEFPIAEYLEGWK